MKTNKLFGFFLNNPFYTKLLFIFTFIFYGVVISSISFSISNHYQTMQTKSKLIKTQKQSFDIKSKHLQNLMNDFQSKILSIKNSDIFNDYLVNRNNDEHVRDLFSVMINHSIELSQLRYIDEEGFERVRFDRNELGVNSYEVPKGKLQNKSSRYYFNDIKNVGKNNIWISKLDLNVEYGKIQLPIVPTLRIGTPIYNEQNQFKGIVIMNIFFKDIIDEFVSTPFFYITIYDKDGEFIHHKHPDKNGVMTDYSWSRYLNNDFNLSVHKQNLARLLNDKKTRDYIFNISIKDIIPNEDELAIYYEPKMLKLQEIEKDERKYISTVTIIVLAVSIPLALIISIIPSILNRELFETKKLLEEEAKVVDENVYLSVTDINGNIIAVSRAYEVLTGYTKEELIGRRHNILRHANTNDKMYKNLWQTILSKKEWKGEIENIKKDGSSFFSKVLIKPNLDKNGNIASFTAYAQDITYQKKIEKLSITDELTGLYNRREFNRVLKRNLAHCRRYNTPFSMIILDIDFFKQFNDTYGHQEGDVALKMVAEQIHDISKRETDLGFRLGGEEFGVIFSSNEENSAKEFAQKLKQHVEDMKIEHRGSKVSEHLTISVGLLYLKEVKELSTEHIYSLCDKALYEAKERGRNRVVVSRL